MLEPVEQVGKIEPGALLPTGVIVGSAVISNVIPRDPSDGESGLFRWNLSHIKRLATPRKPKGNRSRCGLSHFQTAQIFPIAWTPFLGLQ